MTSVSIFFAVAVTAIGAWWIVDRRRKLKWLLTSGIRTSATVIDAIPVPESNNWEVVFQFSPDSSKNMILCNDYIFVAPLEPGPKIGSMVSICYFKTAPESARLIQSVL